MISLILIIADTMHLIVSAIQYLKMQGTKGAKASMRKADEDDMVNSQ
jgi:hypothetical protein